jgi:oligosaccharide repeat unit polymerase
MHHVDHCFDKEFDFMKYGSLKRFLIVWLIYWITFLLQPVKSLYPDVYAAFILQLVFVFFLSISYVVAVNLWNTNSIKTDHGFRPLAPLRSEKIIKYGLLIGALGFGFLLYDKIVYQGIDYSDGLAVAREQWRDIGEQRHGDISSPFSVLGYLIGGAYFFPLTLTLSSFVFLKDPRRFAYIVVGVFLLICNSLITGGRSSIILAVALSSFGYFSSKKFGPLFKEMHFVKSLVTMILLVFFYLVYVFYSRAEASGFEVERYGLEFLEYLGLESYEWFASYCQSSSVGGILSLLNLTVSYLTHGVATTAAIVQNSSSGSGDVIFSHFYSLGAKVGLTDPPVEWFLAGRSPSLPGALYLMYGISGLIFGASVIGVISAISVSLFCHFPRSILLFGLCAIFESILILSPFFFVGDLLSFPFAVIGGLILMCFVGDARRLKK